MGLAKYTIYSDMIFPQILMSVLRIMVVAVKIAQIQSEVSFVTAMLGTYLLMKRNALVS